MQQSMQKNKSKKNITIYMVLYEEKLFIYFFFKIFIF